MRKLLVELAYNGAAFHGWQVQKTPFQWPKRCRMGWKRC